LGRVSHAPRAEVRNELDRLKREETALFYVADDLQYGDFTSFEKMLDRYDFDSDIDRVLALEASRRLLDPLCSAASLEEARRIIDLIGQIGAMREEARQKFFAQCEADQQAVVDQSNNFDFESNDEPAWVELRRRQDAELEVGRKRIRSASPVIRSELFNSPLRYLIEPPNVREFELANPSHNQIIEKLARGFWTNVIRQSNQGLDQAVHGIHIPSYDARMDKVWSHLEREKRDEIIHEVRRSVVIWQIAEPALIAESRPGVLPALLWGLQIPFRPTDRKTLSKSGLDKNINNLRNTWAQILARDPSVVLWAAWVLVPPGAFNEALDALLGLATHAEWAGKKGRKTLVPLMVSSWKCSVCGCNYEPGDGTHNSPRAEAVKKSVEDIDAFTKYGRIVKGLPDRAHPWQRLMCNNYVEGHPCWHRGGVLVPTVNDGDLSAG
jgi:hypothetical protein